MQIINKTQWDTKALRKLCLIVIKHYGSHKDHRITIISRKNRGYAGRASIGGSWITMKVPDIVRTSWSLDSDGKYQIQDAPSTFEPKIFAQVLEHEIAHNFGLRHKEMGDCKNCSQDVSYIGDFNVRVKEKKQQDKIDIKQMRYEKAKNKVNELENKLRRTEKLLNKWKRKVKYYESKNI